MATPTNIRDSESDAAVRVTKNGEMAVGPLSHSYPYYVSVALLNTEYEVVPAIAGKCFVITGFLIASDKDFGSATVAETLSVYEANPADITINEKTILQVDFLRNDRLVATGLDLLVSESKALVAVATDSAVDVTVAGYYIDA